MKKAITILTVCLLAIAGMQTVQAQTKEELERQIENIIRESDKIMQLEMTPCQIAWKERMGDGDEPYFITQLDLRGAAWLGTDHSVKSDKQSVVTYNSYSDRTMQLDEFVYRLSEKDNQMFADKLNALARFCEE